MKKCGKCFWFTKEVDLQNKIAPTDPAAPPAVVTVSVDEKPGLQAIANTAVFNPGSGTAFTKNLMARLP